MNAKRWIALLLLLTLTLTSLAGCSKKPPEDEMGVVEGVVENAPAENTDDPDDQKAPEDTKDPDDNTEPDDPKEPADTKDPDDQKEPEDTKDPDENTEPDKTPDGDQPGEPNAPGDEDLPPITKESSGTPITFLMQNLRTAGNQNGLSLEERSGGDLNLYRRKFRFKQLVLKQDPDVILAQECTPGWLNFFQTDPYFSQTYTIVWTYRKPGSVVEMCTPVLYKTAKYTAVRSGHFWFSETPKVSSPTHGYTAADGEGHYRPCSWAQLRDKATGAVFNAYSIHMDAGNDTVHNKSMTQLFEIFDDLGKDAYAFIGGDFNFGFRDLYYRLAVDWEYQTDLQEMAHNMNADGLCELGGTNGSLHTKYAADDDPATANVDEGYFHGIFPEPNPGRKRQLDHIFAKNHPNLAVDYWGFDYTDYEDPVNQVEKGYISDHYGLVCKVRINTKVDYSRYQKQFDGKPAAAES